MTRPSPRLPLAPPTRYRHRAFVICVLLPLALCDAWPAEILPLTNDDIATYLRVRVVAEQLIVREQAQRLASINQDAQGRGSDESEHRRRMAMIKTATARDLDHALTDIEKIAADAVAVDINQYRAIHDRIGHVGTLLTAVFRIVWQTGRIAEAAAADPKETTRFLDRIAPSQDVVDMEIAVTAAENRHQGRVADRNALDHRITRLEKTMQTAARHAEGGTESLATLQEKLDLLLLLQQQMHKPQIQHARNADFDRSRDKLIQLLDSIRMLKEHLAEVTGHHVTSVSAETRSAAARKVLLVLQANAAAEVNHLQLISTASRDAAQLPATVVAAQISTLQEQRSRFAADLARLDDITAAPAKDEIQLQSLVERVLAAGRMLVDQEALIRASLDNLETHHAATVQQQETSYGNDRHVAKIAVAISDAETAIKEKQAAIDRRPEQLAGYVAQLASLKQQQDLAAQAEKRAAAAVTTAQQRLQAYQEAPEQQAAVQDRIDKERDRQHNQIAELRVKLEALKAELKRKLSDDTMRTGRDDLAIILRYIGQIRTLTLNTSTPHDGLWLVHTGNTLDTDIAMSKDISDSEPPASALTPEAIATFIKIDQIAQEKRRHHISDKINRLVVETYADSADPKGYLAALYRDAAPARDVEGPICEASGHDVADHLSVLARVRNVGVLRQLLDMGAGAGNAEGVAPGHLEVTAAYLRKSDMLQAVIDRDIVIEYEPYLPMCIPAPMLQPDPGPELRDGQPMSSPGIPR